MTALPLLLALLAQTQSRFATIYDSGFKSAHDTFNALSAASDGRIYYVLSSEKLDVPAQMFVFDPATSKTTPLGDLDTACNQAGSSAITQGKSHVNFVEANGKLYFATHIGYYSIVDGMETPGIPPPGYKPYPGGHLLAFDMKTRQFDDLATAPSGEGILTMNMDPERGLIYALTWPTGRFLRFRLATGDLKDFGPVRAQGEAGKGDQYRTICRAIAVDPRTGHAYLTDSEGNIHHYSPDTDSLSLLDSDNLRKDYFGQYDPASPGHMGYNWRQIVWVPEQTAFYGVHGNSGYLFRFFPDTGLVEVLDRITSDPSRLAGMFDQFSYGYLGFTLGPDGHTLYYLTGGPVYVDGKRLTGKSATAMGESRGVENLHLVLYDTRTGTRRDYGAIFFRDGRRPSYVNSIAVGADGAVYALSRIDDKTPPRTALIQIQPGAP